MRSMYQSKTVISSAMCKKVVLILLILFITIHSGINETHVTPPLAERPTRIVGGKNAEKGTYLWQVSVHYGDRSRELRPRHVCGGSLLTAGCLLTAGHCKTLAPKRASGEFVILAGKYKLGILEDTEQSRLVYPEYPGTVAPHDIALLKLEYPFDLNSFVSTISLPYPDVVRRIRNPLPNYKTKKMCHLTYQ